MTVPTALPLPLELRQLIASHVALQQSVTDHRQLLVRLDELLAARHAGHSKMELPVELGMGYSIEGVVEDTSKVIINMGVDDLWAKLEVERARDFVEQRIAILDQQIMHLSEWIDKMRKEFAVVAKTLREALEVAEPGADGAEEIVAAQ